MFTKIGFGANSGKNSLRVCALVFCVLALASLALTGCSGLVESATPGKPADGGTTPGITGLSPTSGAIGAPVTIAGANFGTTGGTVTFNGVTATSTNWSATSIAVTVPTGATTGNVVVTVAGMASPGVSFTVTTPAPSITSLNPTSGLLGATVTIAGANFGATQGTSTVKFNGIAATATSWSATSIVTKVPAGATTGNVVVTVGGVASNGVSFTVTSPGPSVTSLNPTLGLVGATVTIAGANFGATQGASTVKFNGTSATVTSWSATSIMVAVPIGATTGNVVVTVGGVASNGVDFTVTLPVPGITSLNPTSGLVGATVTIVGANFGATQGTSTVKFNGTAATATSWSATSIVTKVPAGATTGNVVVTVGGVASNGVAFTVTVSTPSITSLNPTSGLVGATVTIAGANFGATQGTSAVKFNGTAATVTSWSATRIVVTVPTGATTGNVVVTVGGVASNGVNFTVTVPVPSITSLNPTSGLLGATVTMAGANFGATQGTSTVKFNGIAATATSWSATSIVTKVPAGATTGNVVVTVGGVASNGVSFTVTSPGPSVTSLNPTSGLVGATVTIAGTNFGATQGASTVTFNGAATTPTSWTATSIVALVPTGATTGNVVVTVGGVASNGINFTVSAPAPSITSLNPTLGLVGATVTIAGANFGATQGASTVKFNGTVATVTSWSATSIVVAVPTGATTGNVVVTVGGVASSGVAFTVTVPTPSITSLSPNSGLVGASVTITGTNFGATKGSSTVKFNGTTATTTSWSATSIVAPVPTGATTGNVVVTVGGVASNGVSFTVQADTTPPTVPTGLSAVAASSSQINLSWNASTDNVGVTGYNVYRGGTLIGTSTTTAYSDTGLSASTTYTYTVAAFDAAGNISAQSASASATTSAASLGGSQIPSTLGWFNIPNTALNGTPSLCPTYSDIQGESGCDAVMAAWGGGVADPTRNLFIIWGGGHVDYHGNEVYDLNLNVNPATPNLARNASTGANLAGCGTNIEVNPDGTPTSRHTYDGEVYVADQDQYIMIGGSEMCDGGFSGDIWELTPGTYQWTNLNINLPNDGNGGPFPLAAYDPVNKLVYQYDNNLPEFYSFQLSTKTITNLSTSYSGVTCGSGASGGNLWTADIDPVRRLFICAGSTGGYKISLNPPYTATALAMTGCVTNSSAPGWVYYPPRAEFVEWAGGNTVYFYNPDTDSCTNVTYSGGPGAAQTEGTFGRMRYFPQLGVLVVANSMTENFYSLRLDTPAQTSFAYRCSRPGVLNCQGFDSQGIFATAVNTTTPTDGFSAANEPNWSMDTTNYVSGGGSAHCAIPASTGANPCEDYWAMFGQGSNLVNIGAGQSFYVQFAFRADSTWTTTNWTNYGPAGDNTAPKLVIFDNVQSSCDVTEITTHNHDAKDLPIVYTDCGDLTGTSQDGTTWNEDGDYWQQGWLSPAPFTGYECAYNNGAFNGPNCFTFVANQWYTFYYKVSIGTWTGSNSTIEAWVAPYGQQMKQWVSLANYNFGGNDNNCNAAGTGAGSSQCGFNNVHLTQFMTDKNGNDGSPAANVWYDELIISTQPIPSSCLTGCSQP
jgi:hypothetical protein